MANDWIVKRLTNLLTNPENGIIHVLGALPVPGSSDTVIKNFLRNRLNSRYVSCCKFVELPEPLLLHNNLHLVEEETAVFIQCHLDVGEMARTVRGFVQEVGLRCGVKATTNLYDTKGHLRVKKGVTIQKADLDVLSYDVRVPYRYVGLISDVPAAQ